MRGWRRMAIVGVLAWMAAVAIWASRPWSDEVTVQVPKGAPPQSVGYACGRPFGTGVSRVVSKPAAAAGPLAHRPCRNRTERRVLVVVDLAAGAGAVVVLLTRFSARPTEVRPAT